MTTSCTNATHGTTRPAYLKGCRCDMARHAYVRYQKKWKRDRAKGLPRKLPVWRARRRMEALACMGWDGMTIAEMMGNSTRVKTTDQPTIRADVFLRLDRVYQACKDHRGPSSDTARYAMRMGWPSPLAWDNIDDPKERPWQSCATSATSPTTSSIREVDWVKVDRFINGDNEIRLTRAEKHDAYRQLRDRGISHNHAVVTIRVSGSEGNVFLERYEQIGATA